MIALRSHTLRHKKLFEFILLTLLGVLMYVSQVIMASLPNIEIVTLLIIITAVNFSYKSFISVYIFVFCEIITYGLSLWVVNYLYVWAVLVVVICLIRRVQSVWIYTAVSGIYGLLFGTLCSIPYFITGGITFGVTYIINGLWFDILHCAGNLILTPILFKPLDFALKKALKSAL